MNVEIDVFEEKEARRVFGDDFVETLDLHNVRLRRDSLFVFVRFGREASCMLMLLEAVYVVHRAMGLYLAQEPVIACVRSFWIFPSNAIVTVQCVGTVVQTLNEGRNGADESV